MLVSVFRRRGLPKKGTIFQKPKGKNADPEESGPQITSDIEKRAGREEISEDAQHRSDLENKEEPPGHAAGTNAPTGMTERDASGHSDHHARKKSEGQRM